MSSVASRFWSKVSFPAGGRGCWLWTARLNRDGYGIIGVSSRWHRGAHLVAYSMYRGEIADGMELDHLCRVRSCVNPAHLEPVTHAENIRRGDTGRYNKAKTHCPRGHEYSGSNLLLRETCGKYLHRACRVCMSDARNRFTERKSKESP